MKKTIIAALAIVAMVACAKEDLSSYDAASDNIASFVSNEINTRLSSDGTMWSANESIGITMTDNNGSVLTGNVEYVSQNSSEQPNVSFDVATGKDPLLYPNTGFVTFYAYYPFQDAVGDLLVFPADVTDQSTSDFMVAEKISTERTDDAHTLEFTHMFSKVTINITPNENVTSLAGVSASVYGVSTKGNYLISDGSLAGALSGTTSSVSFATVENSTASVTATAILLPETLGSDATITFEVPEDGNTRTFTIKLASGTTFTPSYNHTYNVALGNDMPEFATTSQITEWTPSDEGSLPSTEVFYSYIQFQRNQSSPDNITTVDDGGHIASLLSQFRRGLAYCTDTTSGATNFTYLDNNNTELFEDGNPAMVDGTMGDVMVYFPAFWYKYENVDDEYFRYLISENEISGGVYMEASLVGAYKGRYTSKVINQTEYYFLHSITDGSTVQDYGVSLTSLQILAGNNGSGYQVIDYDHHCIIAMMAYAKYETRDIGSIVGYGSYSGSTGIPGKSNSIGNSDTVDGDSIESSTYACLLGLEGAYSNGQELVQGVTVDNNCNWTISTPSTKSGDVRIPQAYASSGYIVKMGLEGYTLGDNYTSQYFEMIPTLAGTANSGSATLYYTDQCTYSTSATTYYVLVRSDTSSYSQTGVARIQASYEPDSGYVQTLSRLAFRGTINTLSNSDFKAIF